MAGATTPEALSKDDLVNMISETGHVTVERDTLYRPIDRAKLPTVVPATPSGLVALSLNM